LAEYLLVNLGFPSLRSRFARKHSDPLEAAGEIYLHLQRRIRPQIRDLHAWIRLNTWFYLRDFLRRELARRLIQPPSWEPLEHKVTRRGQAYALSELRRRRARRQLQMRLDLTDHRTPSPETAAMCREVEERLTKLPPEWEEAWRAFHGLHSANLSVAQLAAKEGLSREAIYQRAKRARQRIEYLFRLSDGL